MENFREPDAPMIGMFTRGQFFSFFLVALGLAFIVVAKMRPVYPRKLDSATLERCTSTCAVLASFHDELRDS